MAAAQPNGHAAPATDSGFGAQKLQPNDVGWQFVPQYYNFVNKQPHRLHCFYNKRSTFIHGEEGEEAQVALGQQEIHERINAIGYDNCKVFIHSIDSQASAGGGIILLVIGEMSNNNGPWRKFTQTFFLAEQPNGYFVLNDIFRYLKEEEEEDEMELDPADQEQPVGVPAEAPAQVPNAAPVPVPSFNHPPTPDSSEKNAPRSSTPKPSQAPAHPDPQAVPTEAVVASVPDEDKAPQEPSAAVEEPVTTAPPPPVEEAPVPTPAPAAPKANGMPAQAPAAPTAPAKPAAPKTWASMAAASAAGSSVAKAWGGMGSQAAASSSTPAPAPAPAAPAPAPAAPPKKEEAAPANGSLPNLEGKHPYYVNAMKTMTPHCFVKLPGWNSENQAGGDQTDEPAIRAASSRFGEVKNIEIVRDKACAFVEFAKVESARLAIAASLTPAQGGEGGVKLANGRLMSFGPRKEKDERRPKGGAGGPRGGMAERGGRGGGSGAQQGQGQGQGRPQEGQGERGQGAGRGRGGRGRGGPPGGDRPVPQQK